LAHRNAHLLPLALGGALAGGCLDTRVPFRCTDSSACLDNGVQGQCEPNGNCSFVDESCPSKRRFAYHADPEEAGRCTHCGNGVVEPGEECDDKNTDNSDACLLTCKWNTCGDGFMRAVVEECDDGNRRNGDGCGSECQRCRQGSAFFTWDTNGHCYFREPAAQTWDAAEKACEDAAGHLVTYVTDLEATAVTTRLLPAAAGGHWIGMRDETRNGNFTWITSEPLNRSMVGWVRAPTGSRPMGTCLAQTSNQPWVGHVCTHPLPFVCEKPPWEIRATDRHAYKAFYGRVTWEEARMACARMGAHLATLRSPEEHGLLTAKFYGIYWIGASRAAGEKMFRWETMEPFDYSDFVPGNPNETGTSMACLVLAEDRKWRDRPCDRLYPFICEKE
jgi:cysteine-rich repeat protein